MVDIVVDIVVGIVVHTEVVADMVDRMPSGHNIPVVVGSVEVVAVVGV